MRSDRAAALAAAVFLLVAGSPVSAHEETALHALSVLDRVTPTIPGVSFRVVQITQPVLFARNHTKQPLIILGQRGEPFLRLTGARVETNLNSSLTYTSRDPMGAHAALPTDLNPDAPPEWSLLARRRSWSWFDPRIRFAGRAHHNWDVRARLGEQDIVITGSFEPLEGHGHFQSTIDVPRTVPDLELRLLDGLVPGFYVRNDTRRMLRVTGRRGEPFLQIGPRGVFANSRSPDYYLGGNQTVRAVPETADPEARPRWERLSEVPIWSWLEFRARLPARAHQRSVLGAERRVVLDWVTPMTLGNDSLPVRGQVVWMPPQASGSPDRQPASFGIWLAAAAAVIIGSTAALFARRRRAALVRG